jgi:intergrase/recombinase
MLLAGIPDSIADMVSGRTSRASVGITHYLAKKILMLKEYLKVIDDYNELIQEI